MLKTERRILRTGITDGRPSKKVWIGSNFPGGVSWEWHRGREIGQAGQKTPWQSQSFRGIGCISLNNFIPKCPHPISQGSREARGMMRGLGRHHFHSKIGLSHALNKSYIASELFFNHLMKVPLEEFDVWLRALTITIRVWTAFNMFEFPSSDCQLIDGPWSLRAGLPTWSRVTIIWLESKYRGNHCLVLFIPFKLLVLNFGDY